MRPLEPHLEELDLVAAQIHRLNGRGHEHALREAVNASDKAGQTLRGAKSLLPMPTTITDSASSPAAPVNAALNSSRSSPVLVVRITSRKYLCCTCTQTVASPAIWKPQSKQCHGAGQSQSSTEFPATDADGQHSQLIAQALLHILSMLASVRQTDAK